MIDSPVWSTFDASAPPPLPDHSARPGRLVAVVATSEAQSGGWALATTVDLVKSWGDEGHKVVLADLALDSPELHRQLGTENTEGVVDTVLFGASVRRVARPAEEGAYFFITAGTFGAMSLYGYTTKRSLARWGSFLFMGLIGVIIAMVVNIFMQSSVLHFVISVVGVLVFTGLTAYDTQRIKKSYVESDDRDVMTKKAIMGAISLYLNFLNLFMLLLMLFGGGRD